MRATAVLMVVVGHIGLGEVVPGGAGVTIFFGISGFIITLLLVKESQRTGRFDIRSFYIRRAVKIIPPLVVAVVVPTLLLASAGEKIDWRAFSGQMLFFYNWIYLDHGKVFPGTGVVWSLSIEEQFYIVFALLWLWLSRSPRALPWLGAIAVVAIASSTSLRIIAAKPGNPVVADQIYFGSLTRADSLAWGVVAAIAFSMWRGRDETLPGRLQRFCMSNWAAVAAVAIFLLSLLYRDDWFRQTFRYSLQSIATCLIALYGFSPQRTIVYRAFSWMCRLPPLQIVGLASYSIYLAHLSVAAFVLERTATLATPVATALAFISALTAGIILYRIVEVPARETYDRHRKVRPPDTISHTKAHSSQNVIGAEQ